MNKRHVHPTRLADSAQVRSALIDVLTHTLGLRIAGRQLDAARLWDLLLAASLDCGTIESACTELPGVSGNTVRAHLLDALGEAPDDLAVLERSLNRALHTQLPRHFRQGLHRRAYDIAIDMVEIPYHGRALHDPREVRRGPARSGTQRFHTYATLAVVHDDQRYELALTFVWKHETLVAIVERLVQSALPVGLHIRTAYLDKGFRGVAVLRWLRQHRIPYVIPVPCHGRVLKALRTGRRSYRTRHTFKALTAEPYTTDLVIVIKHSAGRHGRHGRVYLVYAVYKMEQVPENQLHALYRRRFGIESGYRQMHQVRARTASRNPVLRLLLVGLAVLILNTYLALRRVWWTVRHYGTRVRRRRLTLKRLSHLLRRLIEQFIGVSAIQQVARSPIYACIS